VRLSFGESPVPVYLYLKSKSRGVKVVKLKVQAHDNPLVNSSGHFFASTFFLNGLQTDLVSHFMFRIMLVAVIRCYSLFSNLRSSENRGDVLKWKRLGLGVPDYLRMMTVGDVGRSFISRVG
jgi:hypothetical protein